MSYLVFSESLSTSLHQLSRKALIFGDKLARKKAYFESIFKLDKKTQLELVKIIEQLSSTALLLDYDKLEQIFTSKRTIQVRDPITMTSKFIPFISPEITFTISDGKKTIKEKERLHKVAVKNATYNKFTNVTTWYPLFKDSRNFYLIYFTFDSDLIKSMQVLCSNDYGLDDERYRLKLIKAEDTLSKILPINVLFKEDTHRRTKVIDDINNRLSSSEYTILGYQPNPEELKKLIKQISTDNQFRAIKRVQMKKRKFIKSKLGGYWYYKYTHQEEKDTKNNLDDDKSLGSYNNIIRSILLYVDPSITDDNVLLRIVAHELQHYKDLLAIKYKYGSSAAKVAAAQAAKDAFTANVLNNPYYYLSNALEVSAHKTAAGEVVPEEERENLRKLAVQRKRSKPVDDTTIFKGVYGKEKLLPKPIDYIDSI